MLFMFMIAGAALPSYTETSTKKPANMKKQNKRSKYILRVPPLLSSINHHKMYPIEKNANVPKISIPKKETQPVAYKMHDQDFDFDFF